MTRTAAHNAARTAARTADWAADLAALAERVRGSVLTPGDGGYDQERAGFQTARRHRPDVLVGATGAADVRLAVSFANAFGLPVAVQGTGHALLSVAVTGGVLITTRRMNDVRIDAERRTARVAAGARWDQVVRAAAPSGLAPLSGSAPHVGAVSYTLGGGLGLLSRRYGYAADHVSGLDVVTADAKTRQVTADSDPELFWALRGGRDNFGVVTSMEIDLVPVTRLYGGGLFYAADLAGDVFDTYLRWTGTIPDDMGSAIALMSFPDRPGLPEPLRGRRVVHVRIACATTVAAAERLVAPLRSAGPRLMDTLGELPYTAAGSIYQDPVEPVPYECGNVMLRDLDAAGLRTLLDLAGPDASVPHVIELRHLGGRLARPPAIGNAVGNRDARYVLIVLSRLDRADRAAIGPAHRRLFEALSPWRTGGRFLNFMFGEHDADQVPSAYEPADYRRLTELKAIYDPYNTFRLNHNIPPAVADAPMDRIR